MCRLDLLHVPAAIYLPLMKKGGKARSFLKHQMIWYRRLWRRGCVGGLHSTLTHTEASS